MDFNPVLLEVFKNRLSSIAEEMGVVLYRTAFSPNIKERRDFSCALFQGDGELIAQAAHIPVHLGSMPMSVKAILQNIKLHEGDMAFLNDPFQGGTHLPDITIVAPVFTGNGAADFFVACRAHHSDVGGMAAGSMPLATSIFQEGLIIPPVKIVRKGEIIEDVMNIVLRNVRTPEERKGDFASQIMANNVGIKRLAEVTKKYGLETVKFYSQKLIDYAEEMTRVTIRRIPDGVYEYIDYLDDDGQGTEDIPLEVKITIFDDEMEIDFQKSSQEVAGGVNAVYAITVSAVLYVISALGEERIPKNSGCLRPLRIVTQSGSVLHAEFPAAVAAGNVETSQRIVDVLLGALSRALPEIIPAASQGTMNNVTIGGWDGFRNIHFTYYETIGGGTGASKEEDGANALHSHMTNTMNTPAEALEFDYPLRVESYHVRRGSGGTGNRRGGDGIVRELRLLTDAHVNVLSERRKYPPYGLSGGEPGSPGKNIIIRDGQEMIKPGKFSANLLKGDILRIETPGGGGFGKKQ